MVDNNITYTAHNWNELPSVTITNKKLDLLALEVENNDLKTRIGDLIESNKDWKIKDVYFNPPYVTVKWRDGSISHSKQNDADEFDFLIGFMIAIGNHMFKNRDERNNIFQKYYNRYLSKLPF